MSNITRRLLTSKGFVFRRRLGISTVMLLVLGLAISVTVASASYEQVGTFAGQPGKVFNGGEPFPEEDQLGGASGIAVNSTGAGGVPAGTIYTISYGLPGVWVARYNPDGSFSERWSVEFSERCGPEGEPAHPTCAARPYGGAKKSDDIEVDQSTGDVYVAAASNSTSAGSESDVVKIYSPNGANLIARFAEQVLNPEREPISAKPEKVSELAGLAVGSDGTVYLADEDQRYLEHRIMVWRPETPGDYEHYVYTGESHDIASGHDIVDGHPNVNGLPTNLAIDDAGNLYGDATENSILEYSLAEPSKPVCRFSQPAGGISTMAVDPRSGEVFYFDYKKRAIHELAPCNGSGEFVETGTIMASPKQKETYALGFDPLRTWAAGRQAGVLYAVSSEAEVSGESPLGFIFAPPLEVPPAVGGEEVIGVTAGAALLRGTVNANSVQTRYGFQYVSVAAYEANPAGEGFAGALEAPAGGAVVEGAIALPVSAAVSGLVADTAYRYRLVAKSHCSVDEPERVCETDGAEREFHTYPVEGAGLADGREYELVSPVDKNGGEVVPAFPMISSCVECKPGSYGFNLGPMQNAPDGESIVYNGTAFSPSEGAIKENSYYSKRTPAGWRTTILSPSDESYGANQGYVGFSRDLSGGVLSQFSSMSADAPVGYANLYAQSTVSSGDLRPLVATAPPNRPAGTASGSFSVGFGGASEDFSRIFFGANDALTGATAFAPAAVYSEGANNLYESSGGALRLVNVVPGNTETSPGAVFGSGSSDDGARTVSRDGTRAFWASADGKSYVRINGELTREIPDASAHYLTASVDGSRVLMSDGRIYGRLEAQAPVEEFDLTEGKGGFLGVAGESEDLSRIYFVDTAVLDEAPNAQGAVAEVGKDNLYSWAAGSARFIAQLASEDGIRSAFRSTPTGGYDWVASPLGRSAEASPDGRWLAFASRKALTGYDNVGLCSPVAGSGENVGSTREYEEGVCEEVFLYDAVTGDLRCASCNPSGERPHGNSVVRLVDSSAGEQPRYVTDSGRLFFDSADSLASGDTNGDVEDVYELEPDAVGGCTLQEGCVSLISAGTGLSDSNLVSIDESGKNVFFTTRDQLVRVDHDQAVDLYDAREGGRISSQSAPPASECEAECQPAVAAYTGSPSLTLPTIFAGAGNLVAPLPASAGLRSTNIVISAKTKLTRALKACRKDKSKSKRVSCEKRARNKYHPKPRAKTKTRKGAK
jgi:hypothetical protein